MFWAFPPLISLPQNLHNYHKYYRIISHGKSDDHLTRFRSIPPVTHLNSTALTWNTEAQLAPWEMCIEPLQIVLIFGDLQFQSTLWQITSSTGHWPTINEKAINYDIHNIYRPSHSPQSISQCKVMNPKVAHYNSLWRFYSQGTSNKCPLSLLIIVYPLPCLVDMGDNKKDLIGYLIPQRERETLLIIIKPFCLRPINHLITADWWRGLGQV